MCATKAGQLSGLSFRVAVALQDNEKGEDNEYTVAGRRFSRRADTPPSSPTGTHCMCKTYHARKVKRGNTDGGNIA